MPDLPLITLLRVCRVTPRTFAPSVTDSPNGARQAGLMLRPGCGGFFIGMFASLALVYNVKCILSVVRRFAPRCRYLLIPTWLSSQAYSKAVSCRRSYRPLAPPWPAGSILILSSRGLVSVFNVRSLATYLAGSQYITWLSLKLVVTRMAGYARFSRLSYGLYVFM